MRSMLLLCCVRLCLLIASWPFYCSAAPFFPLPRQSCAMQVTTVCCSPADANRAVSGSTDRTIKVRYAPRASRSFWRDFVLLLLLLLLLFIISIFFSFTLTLLSPTSPAACQVWNLQRGFIDNTIVCHSSVNAVTTTLDGQIVISGASDRDFWPFPVLPKCRRRILRVSSSLGSPCCRKCLLASAQATLTAPFASGTFEAEGPSSRLREFMSSKSRVSLCAIGAQKGG